jgi:uncharacterized membrane-anchored protein
MIIHNSCRLYTNDHTGSQSIRPKECLTLLYIYYVYIYVHIHIFVYMCTFILYANINLYICRLYTNDHTGSQSIRPKECLTLLYIYYVYIYVHIHIFVYMCTCILYANINLYICRLYTNDHMGSQRIRPKECLTNKLELSLLATQKWRVNKIMEIGISVCICMYMLMQ